MSKCHPTNPTGTFSVDPDATNVPGAHKGIIVNISLPNDQNGYQLFKQQEQASEPDTFVHRIILQRGPAITNGILPVTIPNYTRTNDPKDNRLKVELHVYLNNGSDCEPEKKEERQLNGQYAKK